MTKRQKRALLARRLRNKADRYLKYWEKNDPIDGGYSGDILRMVRKDHKDMYKAAKWLREGKEMKAARLIVYDFDTAVRDEVPTTVYNYLEKVFYG